MAKANAYDERGPVSQKMRKMQGVKPHTTIPKPNTVPPSQNKRYDAGKGRKVTVAYSGEAKEVLRDVIRDNLSPQAVAAIVAYLQPPADKRPRAFGWGADPVAVGTPTERANNDQ